jgi:tRNA nucleotidyltransferase/poly(A) polymerase
MLLCHCEGIGDLKKGLIDTPLDAKATFMDDPLRVLRAIRFGKFKHLLAYLNIRVHDREICNLDYLRVDLLGKNPS